MVLPDTGRRSGCEGIPVRGAPSPGTDRGVATTGSPAGWAKPLLREPIGSMSPVLRTLLQRTRDGSMPGQRVDDHVVCLAIEGGGMRGAVTAGMCLVLEAAGLTQAFDRVYGVSAGALNGWALCAGQAAVGAMHYQDAVAAGVVDLTGPLWGRPLVDFELLFDDLIAARRPLSFERLASGPDLRVLATSLETTSLRVLQRFEDLGEVLAAVRASSFLPRFSGAAPLFRGEHMADGSLLEPIPLASALEEGATHVLVLRSRPADYRKSALSELGELLALRGEPALAETLRARQAIYNRQAAELQEHRHPAGTHVHQVAVEGHARLVAPLQASAERVGEALQMGAGAMAGEILARAVDVHWLPVLVAAPAESLQTNRSHDGGAGAHHFGKAADIMSVGRTRAYWGVDGDAAIGQGEEIE